MSATFDRIFIGTGIVSMLEAVYEDRCGRRVLMIDEQPDIGGAWRPWSIFGFDDVENAVHYLLPHPRALAFLKEVLAWPIVRARGKFLLFPDATPDRQRVPFDDQRERLRARLARREGMSPLELARIVAYWGRQSLAPATWRSHYIEGGTPEIIRRMRDLLRSSRVEVRLSTAVTGIDVLTDRRRAVVRTSDDALDAERVAITHGSHLRGLTRDRIPVYVDHERHRRPHVHVLVRDQARSGILEGVFVRDAHLKYVHDVTRFARRSPLRGEDDKVLVLALHPHIEEAPDLYERLIGRLKVAGIIGSKANLLAQHWWEWYLPPLSTDTLRILRRDLAPVVTTLSTENFTESIGLHATRWSAVLSGAVRDAGHAPRTERAIENAQRRDDP